MKEKIFETEKRMVVQQTMGEDEKRKVSPFCLIAAEKEELMKEHQEISPNMKSRSFVRKNQ